MALVVTVVASMAILRDIVPSPMKRDEVDELKVVMNLLEISMCDRETA